MLKGHSAINRFTSDVGWAEWNEAQRLPVATAECWALQPNLHLPLAQAA
jgi:hypothetical protein